MTNDEPLERNLESLFSDAVVVHPNDVGAIVRSPPPLEAPGGESRMDAKDGNPRSGWSAGTRWGLGIFCIVLALAVLVRAVWEQKDPAPPVDIGSRYTEFAVGIAAGVPVTPVFSESNNPPRKTVVARTALPSPPSGLAVAEVGTPVARAGPEPARITASPALTATPLATHSLKAPTSPSGLAVAPIDSGRVRLTWRDNSDDEIGFRIFRGKTFVIAKGANSNTTIVRDLEPESYACFHLYAFNENGNSDWTEWACVTMPSQTPTPTGTPTETPAPTRTDVPSPTPVGQVPPAPSSLSAIAIGATRVRLDWQDNASNETGFVIRAGEEELTVGVDTESILFTGLEPETEYCYAIQASNYDGASLWTEQVCVTTPPMFVAVPMFGLGDTFDVAWGDYDNDGDQDLVVANDGELNHLYVNQSGAFVQTEQFGAGRSWSLAWGDYDDDGDLDLAVGNGFGWAQNYLYTNNGDASFLSVEQFDAASTSALAWADYDDDGDLDLAVGNEWDQQNFLFTNRGNGSFNQVPAFGSGITYALAWGDVDNDGDPDLAVGNHGQNYISVNDGGVFEQLEAYGAATTNALAWQDFDRDGDLDLAVGNDEDQQNYLYVNEGAGVFSTSVQFGAGHTSSLAWGDYNSDGDPDLAVGNFWDQANVLYTNNGDGTFSPLEAFGAGSTSAVAWGDFDNDGDLDLAVGNGSGQQNYLYVNQITALAPGLP